MKSKSALLLPLIVLGLAAAITIAILIQVVGDSDEDADDFAVGPVGTAVQYPSGQGPRVVVTPPDRPDEVAIVPIEIDNGEFQRDEITIAGNEPVLFDVENNDQRTYRVLIPDVTAIDDVPGQTLTRKQFVATESGIYEARLLLEGESAVIDTMVVIVE